MTQSQFRSKRKPSGGRYKNTRSKSLAERGAEPMSTRIGEKRTKTVEGPGSTSKRKAHSLTHVTVNDGKGKTFTAEMTNVVESPANRNYVRRNIITKGAIVETAKGKVRITNRPSQEGVALGVLVE